MIELGRFHKFLENKKEFSRHSCHPTLLEKQSKFPRYNMKCSGKLILREIFRVVSRFPHYISLYIAESRLPLGQCAVGKGLVGNIL